MPLEGVHLQNFGRKVEYTSRIYENAYMTCEMLEEARMRLPLGVVENDFAGNLFRSLRTSLIIELNCYLIQNWSQKHSIGTIVGELEEINNEDLSEVVKNEINEVIQEYENFCVRNEGTLQSIYLMRNKGYAHIDDEEELDQIPEVNLVDIRQMFEESVTILNSLRELVRKERLGNVLIDDGSIEEAFQLLGDNFT